MTTLRTSFTLALFTFALAGPAPTSATTWTIVSTADAVGADGACSLREALRAAQTNAAVFECAAGGTVDEIVLAVAGPYLFDQGQETFSGSTAELTIRGAVPGGASTIDLGGANRLLHVSGLARLSLRNLALVDGSAHGQNPAYGGALRIESAGLTLADVRIAGSTAVNGGAVTFTAFSPNRHLVVERVLFEDNLATAIDAGFGISCAGGALDLNLQENSTARLTDVVFADNRAASSLTDSIAIGGAVRVGLHNSATIELRRVEFLGNEVEAPGFANAAGIFLNAGNSTTGSIRLEDLRFEGGVVSGGTQSGTTRELLVGAHGSMTATVRRVRVYGIGLADDSDVAVTLSAQSTSTFVASDLLSVGGPPHGVRLSASDTASLVAGNLTVVGHDDAGLQLAESSGSTLRVENSILWGNGGAPADDVEVQIGTPDYDRVAQHNWIGELGDPDPLFVASGAGDFHLEAASGALDAGDADFVSVGTYDADHAPRVAGAGLDLGAFERDALFADSFESADTGAWSSI